MTYGVVHVLVPCCREVYYTKRMQRISCVQWSGDDKFILCGSDEMNIRLWKAHASEKLGAVSSHKKYVMCMNILVMT